MIGIEEFLTGNGLQGIIMELIDYKPINPD